MSKSRKNQSELLSTRAKELLKKLIVEYLKEGSPIASKKLANCQNVALSSASIRLILNELEQRGFLRSPHTSAGRVPTHLGMRFFVDSLLTVDKQDLLNEDGFMPRLDRLSSREELLEEASAVLSEMTNLVSIVTVPKCVQQVLKKVEFVRISKKRVLAVLVLNNQDVENRLLEMHTDFTASDLTQMANYFNEHYVEKDLSQIREQLVKKLELERQYLDDRMREFIQVGKGVFKTLIKKPDFILKGQSNLFAFAKDSGQEQLRCLFEAFAQRSDLLGLLDQCIQAERVQIFLGEENGLKGVNDFGLVSAPYREKDNFIGVLGVIGPTRMPYEQIINAVKLTSTRLTHALNNRE